jgi:hypothetical protein
MALQYAGHEEQGLDCTVPVAAVVTSSRPADGEQDVGGAASYPRSPAAGYPASPTRGGSVHFSGRLGGAAAAPEHDVRANRQLARGERSISAEVGDVTGRIPGIAGPLRDIERGTRD